MPFSGWEVAPETYLDMSGPVYYLANTERVIVLVVQVLGMEILTMTTVLGLAFQELSC